ncbi:hypothetical protein EDD86DRAFT_208820 [Gorgonomyces haynaldii]|nr:hypothetical protein EDD86DRAFT_208820 [Gorgonomyces haynaldii]
MIQFLLSQSVAASWQRRVYYTDLQCKGNFQWGEQVFIPSAACQASSTDYGAICEIKSTDSLVQSSEGTSCETGQQTDAVFMTNPIPGSNYLVLNSYLGTDCSAQNSKQITQRTYAADGKCHVFEPGAFFKASCTADSGTITFCTDSACQNCQDNATTSAICGQGLQIDSLPTKMICATPESFNKPTTTSQAPLAATQGPAQTTQATKNNARIPVPEIAGLVAGALLL